MFYRVTLLDPLGVSDRRISADSNDSIVRERSSGS